MEGRYSQQHLILGTHTSEGEQNYLMKAEVHLPLADAETEAKSYDDERGEVGGFGAIAGKVQVSCRVTFLPWARLAAAE